MTDYKISIIIPTFNSKDYLDDCISSLIRQTFGFENIEVIFVDDASSDLTPEILKGYCGRYENVRVVFSQKNTGSPSKPRNIGIENATSDYIMFMDHDDVYYPQMCEVMYDAITGRDVDIVSCRLVFNMDNRDCIMEKTFLDEMDDVMCINSVHEMPCLLTTSHPGFVWNKIFKRKFITDNNIRFPDDALYEDICFMIPCYLKARGILLLNDFWGYCYIVRSEGENKSASETFDDEKLLMRLRGLDVIFDLLDEYRTEFPSLEGEMLVGWTKIFIFTNPENKREILKKAKRHYSRYRWNTRIFITSIPFNVCINLFMIMFRSSDTFAVLLCELYWVLFKAGIVSKKRRNS